MSGESWGKLAEASGSARCKFRDKLGRQAGSVLWGSSFGIAAKEIAVRPNYYTRCQNSPKSTKVFVITRNSITNLIELCNQHSEDIHLKVEKKDGD